MTFNAKRAGKALESEVEDALLKIADQDKDMDVRTRTHRIITSGSMKSDKGDVVTNIPFIDPQILIECKRRATKTKKGGSHIDIEYGWLDKVVEEAELRKCLPVLVYAYRSKKLSRRHAMVPRVFTQQYGLNHVGVIDTDALHMRDKVFRMLWSRDKERKDEIHLVGLRSRVNTSWAVMSFERFLSIIEGKKYEEVSSGDETPQNA
jgi:hypothetical protein